MDLWGKDVNSKILTGLMSVSSSSYLNILNSIFLLFPASSERLKQAAAASLSTVYSAGSNVFVGALVIILATALGALAFTARRSRAKMRKIEEIRWNMNNIFI